MLSRTFTRAFSRQNIVRTQNMSAYYADLSTPSPVAGAINSAVWAGYATMGVLGAMVLYRAPSAAEWRREPKRVTEGRMNWDSVAMFN